METPEQYMKPFLYFFCGVSIVDFEQVNAGWVIIDVWQGPKYSPSFVLVLLIVTIFDALHDLVPFVQFKKREKNYGGGILLVKLQAKACNFTKSIIPPWLFYIF